ncbi:hypothetical protein HB771_37025 (plasmid) [Rhizobium leguminosarum bv. viciae]|nr:hypothetical protein HB771_37025 [Rhizobium leguminosarum bv. viciae]
MTKPPRSKKTVGYSIRSYRLAGLVIGGMIADGSDGAVAALRHWLKIISSGQKRPRVLKRGLVLG